jgi:16S rRNA (uracil1498-N3)-methyltransferase
MFRRSLSVSPRGEGDAFDAKVRARMIGALEQSGGAWLPRILPATTPPNVVVGDDQLILLDRDGPPLPRVLRAGRVPVILLGPEGGVEPDERADLLARGWQLASLSETVLRFETAGVAALAICRAHLLGERNG